MFLGVGYDAFFITELATQVLDIFIILVYNEHIFFDILSLRKRGSTDPPRHEGCKALGGPIFAEKGL